MKIITKIGIAPLMLLLLKVPSAGATGFRIPDQSACATAQADAFAAQADDPSAIHYNPAGLVQLDGTHALIGVSLVAPRVEYKSLAGEREDMRKEEYFPPYGYVSTDLGTESWRFGLGFNAPFGLGTKWSRTGFSRYWATLTKMKHFNINPTVAYQILPGLSIGVGADYYYSELISERQVDFGAFIGRPGDTSLDGTFRADVDGNGWGYNLGLLYQPSEQHSFGLSFRSGVKVKYHGDSDISNIPAFMGVGPTISSGTSSRIDFPPYLVFGYAFRPCPELKLELDIDWTGWKTFRELELDFDSENPFFQDNTIAKDWHNAIFYGLGCEYQISEPLTLRGGVGFMESPIPERTFDTSVVRTKQYALSFGLGYRADPLTVDFAYLGSVGEKKLIENNVGQTVGADLDGYYRPNTHILSLDVACAF